MNILRKTIQTIVAMPLILVAFLIVGSVDLLGYIWKWTWVGFHEHCDYLENKIFWWLP